MALAVRVVSSFGLTPVAASAAMTGVLRGVLRWIVILPLWQSSNPIAEPEWPEPTEERGEVVSRPQLNLDLSKRNDSTVSFDASIRQIPLCVVSSKKWSGDLGPTLLFHTRLLSSSRLAVGYFAFWTTERPFGDNALTRWVLPAVAIDAVYSHLLFVLPGLQQLMYGQGDVEGARVTFRIDESKRLLPISIVADNTSHQEVAFDASASVDEDGRILLLTDAWSHQLGGKGAKAARRLGAKVHCFVGNSLVPMPKATASAFRLGDAERPRRARPAWRLAANERP